MCKALRVDGNQFRNGCRWETSNNNNNHLPCMHYLTEPSQTSTPISQTRKQRPREEETCGGTQASAA